MDITLFGRGIKVGVAGRPGAPERLSSPAKVTLLLRQGAGAACEPVVEAGDQVQQGQIVARSADGFEVLHAPVGGVVGGPIDVAGTDGSDTPALVIEASAEAGPVEVEPDSRPLGRSAKELLERIRAAGVVQGDRDGKALAQLIDEALRPRGQVAATGTKIVRPVQHLAVRCCDVDPHLATQRTITEQVGKETADAKLGIEALVRITGAGKIHLMLGKGHAADGLVGMAEEADWPVHRLDTGCYPFAADPFVAKLVSGKEPPVAFQQVHESGTLVIDLSTVLDVARAVRDQAPVVERLVTVCGPGGTKVLRVAIGSSLAALAEAAGQQGDHGMVVIGGPLNGVAHHTLEYPVTKTTTGLTLVPRAALPEFANEPCISCGLCAMVCPTRLVPGLLSRYCEYARFEEAEGAHLFACVECGCCAYVCPAGRSMVQFMIHAKSEILAARRTG
jgi:electron transport complex protein RnfC